MADDPYDVLGVRRDAGAADIKKAYRARALHPDRHPGDKRAEERFKELAAAYDLLSDDATRARYDSGKIGADGNAVRRRRQRPGGPGKRQRGRRRRAAIRVRGANVDYTLGITLEQATRGVTKRVGMATGKRLDVRVPPGTAHGQTLRLKGQGMAGLGGGAAGDALVEIRIEDDDFFRRDGDDIHIEAEVSLPEAVLGGRIEVPTIDGPVTMSVPANSNTGTVLRLKGKGLARHGEGRGEQYVTLKVVLPDKPDREFTEFVRHWAGKKGSGGGAPSSSKG